MYMCEGLLQLSDSYCLVKLCTSLYAIGILGNVTGIPITSILEGFYLWENSNLSCNYNFDWEIRSSTAMASCFPMKTLFLYVVYLMQSMSRSKIFVL